MTTQEPGVSVGTVLRDRVTAPKLVLELLAGGAGLDRLITIPYIQKTGLALAGYDAYLRHGRVLIFGESEVRYLGSLDAGARLEALRRVLARDIPCVLVTDQLDAGPDLTVEAERAGVPLLRTPLRTPSAIARLTALLEVHLAPRDILHGVLLDILGLGVLVAGESGIGKSECALDLVVRGHRLVADDTVEVYRRTEEIVIGTCPALTRHHMEIRGLGVINVHDLFGVAATRSSKRIELVVQLERWEAGHDYDRLGLDDHVFDILGVALPLVRMPVGPGRNVAMLVEVAARNQLLRARGRHAARDLAARVDRQLRTQGAADGDLTEDADGGEPAEDA
jgi:HPr kinase/phosphorylase